ncbi:conserved Plasmodium protein, unknown function [Plasmodium malariae]|uniref:Uncharacterized protein n=1 Tax=Plasmodium malariae TaxID=5858 RepID=A0A1A8X6Z5_PLAMA|nr:conserved Plasmodium protein, unknown function [Plasmodium malariae]
MNMVRNDIDVQNTPLSHNEKKIELKELRSIILDTNRVITTFRVDRKGNIVTVMKLLARDGFTQRVIHLSEYDYFFVNAEDVDAKERTTNRMEDAEEEKCINNEDSFRGDKIIFYIGNKKVLFDKKKKEKIIFHMDELGNMKKNKYKKISSINSKNILVKTYEEDEWSDEQVDFCYLRDNKHKEKIVFKKNKNGKGENKIIYHHNELTNSKDNFSLYKRNVLNVKEVNLYDDDEAILYSLRQNEKKRKMWIIRTPSVSSNIEEKEGEKKKNTNVKKNVNKNKYSNTSNHIYKYSGKHVDKYTNSSESRSNCGKDILAGRLELYKNISGINEMNQLDIFTTLKKRKEKFLREIYLFNKEEALPIRKYPKARKIKSHIKVRNEKEITTKGWLNGQIREEGQGERKKQEKRGGRSNLNELHKMKNKVKKVIKDATPQGVNDYEVSKAEKKIIKESVGEKKKKKKKKDDMISIEVSSKNKTKKKYIMLKGKCLKEEREDERWGKSMESNRTATRNGVPSSNNTTTCAETNKPYENLYLEKANKSASITSDYISINKLASNIEGNSRPENFIEKEIKETNKKIEDFVFNENLKNICITSHTLAKKNSKNCIQYLTRNKKLPLPNLTPSSKQNRARGVKKPYGGSDVDRSSVNSNGVNNHDVDYHNDEYHNDEYHNDEYHNVDYHNDEYHNDEYHNDGDSSVKYPFQTISRSPNRERAKRKDSPMSRSKSKHEKYTNINNMNGNNISSISSYHLEESSTKEKKNFEKNPLTNQSSVQLNNRMLSGSLSQSSRYMKSKQRTSEQDNQIESSAEGKILKERNEIVEKDKSKGGVKQMDTEQEKRREYLSRGFSACTHIVLSEKNIITRKCTISFDYSTRKLSITRKRKIFGIDIDKMAIEEIPTYSEKVAIEMKLDGGTNKKVVPYNEKGIRKKKIIIK